MMITVNNTEECAQNKVRFVCISDTHGKINFEVPDGHVLSKKNYCHVAVYYSIFLFFSC